MININENFLKLQAGYLFPEIGRRVSAFSKANPDAEIIKLGIGDVTEPLAPAVIKTMHAAVDEMSRAGTFHGYDESGRGYDFLIDAIIENDYAVHGLKIDRSEVFISDGSKCDTGNLQEIFGLDNVVAVADPVYPVYVDTNVMAGRTGPADSSGRYGKIVYMSCTADNNFVPELPAESVDLIYLCFPNNPTGAVATKKQLAEWVEYALKHKAIILFDAAYEAFISDPALPHSIYEIDRAKEIAVEFRSFSKTAGFTGVRCAFAIVPKELKAYKADGGTCEVNPMWARRHCTKFNGVSYITQAGAAAVYTAEGKKQVRKTIELYMGNAAHILGGLCDLGYEVYGGVNAPYVWLKTPAGVSSWDFFDRVLEKAHVVGTPGVGFGAAGQGYLRLSAFNKPENVKEAVRRFEKV